MNTKHASVRIAPGFRCVCGRVLTAYDFVIDDGLVELTCSRCHRRLLEIERHEVILTEAD